MEQTWTWAPPALSLSLLVCHMSTMAQPPFSDRLDWRALLGPKPVAIAQLLLTVLWLQDALWPHFTAKEGEARGEISCLGPRGWKAGAGV